MADTKLTGLTQLNSPAIDDWLYIVDKSDTTDDAAGSSRKILLSDIKSLIVPAQTLIGGRLTLATGTPVTTTDQTAKSTIYYTPYFHDQIGIYNGTSWDAVTFTELSLAISGLTSGKNYDLIVYRNAGTTYLDLVPAWTNDTTRANAIAMQNGVWTNSGSITTVINNHTVAANRGTVVGTMRTTGTNTTETRFGTGASQTGGRWFLSNIYNCVDVDLFVYDSTSTWTYGSASYHQANAASGNKVELVDPLGTLRVYGKVTAIIQEGSAAGSVGSVGIGVDSTSSNSAKIMTEAVCNTGTSGFINGTNIAEYSGYPGLGYHYLAWLEYSRISTTTFNGSPITTQQSGMYTRIKA